MKPTGGGLVGSLYLGDHTGERPIPQAIFSERQYLGVLSALRIQDAVRTKPYLFQTRRVEVETRERPQHGEARLVGEPGSDPGREQRSRRIIGQPG